MLLPRAARAVNGCADSRPAAQSLGLAFVKALLRVIACGLSRGRCGGAAYAKGAFPCAHAKVTPAEGAGQVGGRRGLAGGQVPVDVMCCEAEAGAATPKMRHRAEPPDRTSQSPAVQLYCCSACRALLCTSTRAANVCAYARPPVQTCAWPF